MISQGDDLILTINRLRSSQRRFQRVEPRRRDFGLWKIPLKSHQQISILFYFILFLFFSSSSFFRVDKMNILVLRRALIRSAGLYERVFMPMCDRSPLTPNADEPETLEGSSWAQRQLCWPIGASELSRPDK